MVSARKKRSPQKTQALLVVALIVGAVLVSIILISTEKSQLRTSAFPARSIATETNTPSQATQEYATNTFTFSHPINWEVSGESLTSPASGTAHHVGTFIFYAFPQSLSAAEVSALRQTQLQTNDITSWPCTIGSYAATCSAKANHHRDTTAPIGPRLVEFTHARGTLAALIPAPPRNNAEKNLIDSLHLH